MYMCKKLFLIMGIGLRAYGTGQMAGAQYTTISGQVNLAHSPSTVRIHFFFFNTVTIT